MDAPPSTLIRDLAVTIKARLPARSNDSWLVSRGAEDLVLRRHHDQLGLGHELLGLSVAWQVSASEVAVAGGWPAPHPCGQPIEHLGSWWTLEQFLPGEPRTTTATERAELITTWHATPFPIDRLGPRPGALDHLAILTDPYAETVLGGCEGRADREWLLRRLDQARELAEGIDWTASRRVLVHGDLIDQNLLWTGDRLTGLLDLELANVNRRATELLLTWRCRHDAIVYELHRLDPLSEHEWRMLLVDWWALLLTLAAVGLRKCRQPDRWELDGLRRETTLSRALTRGRRP